MNVEEIRNKLAQFAQARNWDQFHTPKNLSMALAAEAAELLEIFQWLTDDQSNEIIHNKKEMAEIRQEIGRDDLSHPAFRQTRYRHRKSGPGENRIKRKEISNRTGER